MPRQKHSASTVKISDTTKVGKKSHKPFNPQLLWPLFKFDCIRNEIVSCESDVFPDLQQINISMCMLKQNEKETLPGSKIFWSKFLMSDEVIFIDRFFSTPELEKMYHELQIGWKSNTYPSKIDILCANDYPEVLDMNRNREDIPTKKFRCIKFRK